MDRATVDAFLDDITRASNKHGIIIASCCQHFLLALELKVNKTAVGDVMAYELDYNVKKRRYEVSDLAPEVV